MKKVLPWILGAVLLALLLLLAGGSGSGVERRLDETVSLRSRDRIPYGTAAAYALLPSLFPDAKVLRENAPVAQWDSVSLYGAAQAVVLVADYFDASVQELNRMARFVEEGNYIFLITRAASEDVETFFDVSFASYSFSANTRISDSLHLRLAAPTFADNKDYTYPGKKYENALYRRSDSSRAVTLGQNEMGLTNFVQLNKGRGSFFLHSAPLAFSNYFLLHKANAAYFQNAISVLPQGLQRIVWNEYYLEKPEDGKEPNWLGALLSYPAFKNGLLLAAATLLVFLLLGMRRRQRMIPPYAKPANDSLDFVKTLGRLYYDRRDHQNLAAKMATYFLEHVRSRYKLPTHTLDEEFAKALSAKSGYAEEGIASIVGTIQYLQDVSFIPEDELAAFYRRLEDFYQNTANGRTGNF